MIESLCSQPGTSKRHPQNMIYPYLLRKVAIRRANQVWALDTTYILMVRGFVYLIGAEYLLRVLPRGTHQWSMFVRPGELNSALAHSDLQIRDLRGMRYVPLVHKASWCNDTKVNYIATFTRTAH